MQLTVGSKLPEFKMFDSDKQEVTNETIGGKATLFLFFPAAFTGVCTKELCSVRDDISRYNNASVQVIGVSTDTLFTLAKFKEEQGLNFTLASDYNKTVCASFGSQYEEFVFGMKGTARRSAFLADKNGIIQYAEVLESAGDIPNFEAISEAIGTL
ncbi:MAG: redoxin domain-containing protein [Bacteroidota bacterium]